MPNREPPIVRGAMPPLDQYWPMPSRTPSMPKGPAGSGRGGGPFGGPPKGSGKPRGHQRAGPRRGGKPDRKRIGVPWLR